MVDDPASPTDNLVADVDWEIDLAFGLSATEGFYLRTDNPNNQTLPDTDPTTQLEDDEVRVGAGLELPDNLKGDIAFLPFALSDNTTTVGTKDLNLNLSLDLKGGGTDSRLSFSELAGALDPANDTTVDIALGGNVDLDLHFETGALGPLTSLVTEAESSAVPKFVADFELTWNFPSGLLEGDLGDLTIAFNDVGIDLGSLLGDFLGPILGEAGRLTKPLKPVVDIVTAPIPGVTDAAQAVGCELKLPFPQIIAGVDLCKVSLLDLYEKQSGTDLTLIRQVISLIQFINAVTDATEKDKDGRQTQPMVPLGSFELVSTTARSPLAANDKDKLIDPTTVDPDGAGGPGSPLPEPLKKFAGAIQGVVNDSTKGEGDRGGFTFPAFEKPERLFQMLLGKDVTLIHWDAGSLEAGVSIPIEIGPPIGPLPLSLGITFSFGVRGHFAVGYDTKGIRLAVQRLTDGVDSDDDDVLSTIGTLFAGIGIDDRLRVNGEPTGEDIPEITLYGSVVAKAALDLLLVEAGIRGGVEATLDANLHDGGFVPDPKPEDLDGVLRLDEIASFLGNPLCLFDYTGKISAFLEAYIDYTLGEESFRIVGPVTLYDFSEIFREACDTKPKLAHVDPATKNLVLHMGAHVGLRDFQEEKEHERFTVRQLDTAGTKFSVSAFGFEEEHSGVTGVIFADGGSGNDTIVLEPGAALSLNGAEPPADGTPPGNTINSDVKPVTRAAVICGGPGVDVIATGDGVDTVVGDGTPSGFTCTTGENGNDEGDDISTAGGGDTVHGTGGGDKIKVGAGGDNVDGGTGNDTVHGGDDVDTIHGGPDNAAGTTDVDTLFGGKGGDTVRGGADKDTIDGNEDDDFLYGGPGNDTVRGAAGGDELYGEDDHDTLLGGDGNDTESGGDGDDDLFGDAGDDTLNGGADKDDLVGGLDNTGVADDVTGDTLNGDGGRDYLLGDEGTIARAAGDDNGVIACAGTFRGNDVLNGGEANDVLHGCDGVDTMHGDDGIDVMLGGGGDDQMFGDADADQMFGDAGADRMQGNEGDDSPMRGGSGADIMKGNAGIDHMYGDDGGDTMFGNADADKLWGGLDGDCMAGNGGSDVLNGDGGNDRMAGGSATAAAADDSDELVGNTGADTIAGDNAALCDGALVLHDIPFVGDVVDADHSGSDTIHGGDQDDVLYGQSGDDNVYGGANVDYLEGNAGRDTMDGQGDQDDLIGGSGHDNGGSEGAIRQLKNVVDDEVDAGGTLKGDFLHGGGGVDYLAGDNADIRRVGGAGLFDPLSSGRSVELYEVQKVGAVQPDASTYGDDDLFGDAGNDAMFGQGDDDRIRGDVGDDYAEGNSGSDNIRGDEGRDDLIGGSSADSGVIGVSTKGNGLYDDSDTIYGESDTTDGTAAGNGADAIAGDNARITEPTDGTAIPGLGRAVELFDVETVSGAAVSADTHGPETLYGNSNHDYIFGQGDIDTVYGGAGNDYAEGNTGADVIYGGEGRDDLIGGGSANGGIIGPLTSGEGLLDTGDTIYGESDTSDGTTLGSDGDAIAGDNARITPLTDGTALPGLGRLVVLYDVEKAGATISADTNGPEFLYGNSNDDFIFGQGDIDVIHGGAGNDYGEGNAGADTLFGGPDEDDLIGGGSAADGIIDPDRNGTGLYDDGDRIYGGTGEDVEAGDNALISRTRAADGIAWQLDPITLGHLRGVKLFDTERNAADAASGNDLVLGGDQRDREFGQGGNDTVKGNEHDDFIEGNQGGDLLEGNFGEDDIIGGSRTAGSEDDGDIIHGGGDSDVAIGDNGVIDRTNVGPPAYYYETYQIGITSKRYIRLLDIDSPDADVAGSDQVSGGSQVDTLFGQGERDYVFGGAHDDYLEGNGGSDFEFGDLNRPDMTTQAPPQLTNVGGLPTLPEGLPLEQAGDVTPESAEPFLSGYPGADGQDDIIGGNSKNNLEDDGDFQYGRGAADFIIGDNGTLARSIVNGAYPTFVDYNATTIVRRVERFCTNAATSLTCESESEFGGDYQEGNAGDDYMWGQDGNDEMYGSTENDDMYGELGDDRMFGQDGEDAMVGDRGVSVDRKLTSALPGIRDTTQGPTFFNYTGLYKDQLDRRVDLTKDFSFPTLAHPGLSEGGNDYMSGGRNHDSMHGAFGDDVMNGDSGGDYMFGGDGGDAIWGGRGSDTNKDARNEFGTENTPKGILTDNLVDIIFGGYGGSAASVGGVFTGGSDIIDWRPRPDDPLAWRQITYVDDDTADLATRTNNQHHQGVDWIYGGWDRDVMQGDLGKNGPDFQDRLLDWVGAYNLYSRCNASYGDDGDVRQHSPDTERFLQSLAYGSGAGTSLANVATATSSGGREMALVYKKDIKENQGPLYPSTPGHFDNPYCNQP
jgi:Ca2+-binding RTX toxin-like protein